MEEGAIMPGWGLERNIELISRYRQSSDYLLLLKMTKLNFVNIV